MTGLAASMDQKSGILASEGRRLIRPGGIALAWLVLALGGPFAWSYDRALPPEPELDFAFPLGGRQGSSFAVTVEGKELGGTYAAWFDCGDVHATIRRVEALGGSVGSRSEEGDYLDQKDGPTHRVVLDVEVDANADVGLHGFRLVTSRGMSNGLPLQVVPELVTLEGRRADNRNSGAQELELPAVVNGSLETKGESDLYSFEVEAGAELLFQALPNFSSAGAYRAKIEMTLYEGGGSWFDPSRLIRIDPSGPILSWEPVASLQRWFNRRDFTAEFVLFPLLTHRFDEPGRYYLSTSAFLGASGPGHHYQLRIVDLSRSGSDDGRWFARPAHPDPGDWLERDSSSLRQWKSFIRPLQPTQLEKLRARSAEPAKEGAAKIEVVAEVEPNDSAERVQVIPVPAIVEGVIASPGDADRFSFDVREGQDLAFEIQTPGFAPPLFNPWLKVLDKEGEVVLTNIFREYGGDGDDVNKSIERKTLYRFERAGTYHLQVSDLTARGHGSRFRYRVLVRPQIPHLGRVEINLNVVPGIFSELVDRIDHINLPVGEAWEIVVVCEKEEGFQGEVVLEAENLPAGVEAVASTPAAWTETLMRGVQFRPLHARPMDPKNYRATREPLTLLLYAKDTAPLSKLPRWVRLKARPLQKGSAGTSLDAGGFPLMVVADRPEAEP